MTDKIIDFRLRPPFGSLLNLNIWKIAAEFTKRMRLVPEPSQLQKSVDLCLKEMDESGIAFGIAGGRITPDPALSASNEDIAKLVAALPGRIRGIGAVSASSKTDTATQASEILDGLKLTGLGIEPGYEGPARYVDDRAYYGAYEVAQARKAPIVITQSALLGPDLSYASAIPVGRVARDFPNLQLVLAHACWPYFNEACGVAFKHANVWLLPDVYAADMPGHMAMVEAANSYLGDRILYGSAYPLLPIKQSIARFAALPLRPEVRRAAFWDNPARLLGLKS